MMWLRRLRPIELMWPVGEFILPYEFAREFRLSFIFFEVHWFAMDHLIFPEIKMRMKSIRWWLN